MASRFAAVTNKEISQIIKQAVPEIYEEGDEVRFGNFTGKALPSKLESMKPVKKFFVYKFKLSLSSSRGGTGYAGSLRGNSINFRGNTLTPVTSYISLR